METLADERVTDLIPRDKMLLGRLSLHPGAAFDEEAAAALADMSLADVQEGLDELVREGLVQRRYSLNEARTTLAARVSEQTDTDEGRHAAFVRLIERYLMVLAAAQLTLNPDRWYLGRHTQLPPILRLSQPEAVALLAGEIAAIEQLQLLAAELGLHQAVWEFPEALAGYFNRRKDHATAVRMHERGLASAETLGDVAAQALMYIGIAQAYLGQRMYRTAGSVATKALESAQEAGHRLLEASGLEALGTVGLATGHTDDADERFCRARQIHIDLDRPRGAALMNRHLGEVAVATGDLRRAHDLFLDALEFFSHVKPDRYHRARCLLLMARLDKRAGELGAAARKLGTVLELAYEIASPFEEANALVELAGIAEAQGDIALAAQHRKDAQELYAGVSAPQAAELFLQLMPRWPAATE